MKSAPWLLTVVIPLALAACSKESKATAKEEEGPAATPVEREAKVVAPTDPVTPEKPIGEVIKEVGAENPPPVVPVSKGIKKQPPPDLPTYAAGTMGPEAADRFLQKVGRRWRTLGT